MLCRRTKPLSDGELDFMRERVKEMLRDMAKDFPDLSLDDMRAIIVADFNHRRDHDPFWASVPVRGERITAEEGFFFVMLLAYQAEHEHDDLDLLQ